MLKQQVLKTIEKNHLIHNGDGIVVGISGGYDSVCLLHILYSLSSQLDIKLFPVHINHMLRGEEALRDENFVKNLCSSLDLDLHIEKIDIAKKARHDKISIEEAGRNARYEVFNSIAKQRSATKIAVAHSRNDQAETILMRIIRGTGLEGLKGMEYKRDNIIRPLLDTDRTAIENYVNENGLEAITDSSNLHTDYFRNRIRLNVLPEINSAAKIDITENLLRLSKIVATDEDYLRYSAQLCYQKCVIAQQGLCIELDLAQLCEMHEAIVVRVLRMAILDICGSINGLAYIHIEKLMELIVDGRTGARVDLPHLITATKSYNSLIISRQKIEKQLDFEQKLEIPGNTHISSIDAIITAEVINLEKETACSEFISKNKSDFTKFIDYEKLSKGNKINVSVRNRRNGDIFKPLNSNGTKKLKEYFIDNKIPREKRDKIPLIAINKEIIWIIGNKTSDNYKVTDNTNSVLKITFAYNKKM